MYFDSFELKLADELMYCFQLFNNKNFSYIKCIFTSKLGCTLHPIFNSSDHYSATCACTFAEQTFAALISR